MLAGFSVGISGAYAHGGEAKRLPDGQCLFKDGHVGECTESYANESYEEESIGNVDPELLDKSGETGTQVGILNEAQGLGSTNDVNSENINIEIPNQSLSVDGATATSELGTKKNKNDNAINTNYAFGSFFLVMLVLGFILVKSRIMKNELINKKPKN